MNRTDFKNVRVVGLAELATQGDMVKLLLSLDVQVHLVQKLVDLPRVPPIEGMQDIVFLPDECPDGEVWVLNGILSQYTSPPAFLVYAREVDFARWSGVLDAGGVDIITMPLSIDKLVAALHQALERIVRAAETPSSQVI